MYRPPLESVICSVSGRPDVNTQVKSPPENGRKPGGRQRCGVSQSETANQHECQPVSQARHLWGGWYVSPHKMSSSRGLKVSWEERTGGDPSRPPRLHFLLLPSVPDTWSPGDGADKNSAGKGAQLAECM